MRWGLYPLLQSAYHQYHSKETAVLKVTNDILLNMNSQFCSVVWSLNLVYVGRFWTGLRSICQEEASVSFLMGLLRTALTCALAYRRDPAWVRSSSYLVPLQAEAHCFAEDTQLYLSFKPDSATDQAEAVRAGELHWWLKEILNVSGVKTESFNHWLF